METTETTERLADALSVAIALLERRNVEGSEAIVKVADEALAEYWRTQA